MCVHVLHVHPLQEALPLEQLEWEIQRIPWQHSHQSKLGYLLDKAHQQGHGEACYCPMLEIKWSCKSTNTYTEVAALKLKEQSTPAVSKRRHQKPLGQLSFCRMEYSRAGATTPNETSFTACGGSPTGRCLHTGILLSSSIHLPLQGHG